MINYFIYGLIFFILAFIIVITFKAINRGLEFKKEKNKLYIEKNYNIENKSNLVDEINQLKKIHKEGSANNEEFKKVEEKNLK